MNYKFNFVLEDNINIILITTHNETTHANIYWYNDDNTSVYLSSLYVNENYRRNGIGTVLQEMRENIGKLLGATYSYLFVKKNTWMHDWYMKRGYVDYKNLDQDEIWMEKNLNNN